MPTLPSDLLDEILNRLEPRHWLLCLQTPMLRQRALQPHLWGQTLTNLPQAGAQLSSLSELPHYSSDQAQLGAYLVARRLARFWHWLMQDPQHFQLRDGALPGWARDAVGMGWLRPTTPTLGARTVLIDLLMAPKDLRFEHGPSALGTLLMLWPQGWTVAALSDTYLATPCAPKAHHVWSMVHWVVHHAQGEEEASKVDLPDDLWADAQQARGCWPELADPLFDRTLQLALVRDDPGQEYLLWLANRMGAETTAVLNRAIDESGETPVHRAARSRDATLWRKMLLCGGDIGVENNQGVFPALYMNRSDRRA